MVRRIELRLLPEIDAELRAAAEEDRRSVQQAVLLAIESYLARRETAEITADADTLRVLTEAREQVCRGDLYSTEDVRAALKEL